MDDERALLEISGMRAGYEGQTVLDGLSLCVRPGEMTALLGLNGSGKSTLLRAAAGLWPLCAGAVFVCGRRVHAMREGERARHIAYVPQRARADEGVAVLDLVLMGANAGTPLFANYSAAQRGQAMACLARLGVENLAGRRLGTLSQGQRQMAVFARAMMQQPDVFLLDEPDGALDLPRRRDMMDCVRMMLRDGRRGALIALHDASLALSCCDRVLILRDGRIACSLDMHGADDETVNAAMRMLYGDVQTVRAGSRFAVLA